MKLDLPELIREIGKRPSMFLSEHESFKSYRLYFEGMFLTLQLSHKINFEREISIWFQPRVAFKASNLNWFEHFKICNEDKTEKDKIEIFIDTMAIFFEENKNKYLNLPVWDF